MWEYEGNQAHRCVDLAKMLWQVRCDTVVSGTVRYKGEYGAVLDPGIGHKVSIAWNCGVTGDESLNAPVRACSVKLAWQGGGLLMTTEDGAFPRGAMPRTSEGDVHAHLSQLGSGGSFRGEGNADQWNRAAFGQDFGQGNYQQVNAAREAAQQNGNGNGEAQGGGSQDGGGGGGGGFGGMGGGGGMNRYKRTRLDPRQRAAMVAANPESASPRA